MELSEKIFESHSFFYRPGTTDENVFTEVVEKQCYRKKKAGFEPQPGEHWLDLGGNVGSFAFWVKLKGATCESYEPDPDCFKILQKNIPWEGFKQINSAVSAFKTGPMPFWKGRSENDHYRATMVPSKSIPRHPAETLQNMNGAFLQTLSFDGVKMDIEGSEGGLIDNWLLPKCEKMVMEYHTSRDQSMENLDRRLKILKSKFENVCYHREMDKLIAIGGRQRTWVDRLIFCWGWKGESRCT